MVLSAGSAGLERAMAANVELIFPLGNIGKLSFESGSRSAVVMGTSGQGLRRFCGLHPLLYDSPRHADWGSSRSFVSDVFDFSILKHFVVSTFQHGDF